MTPKNPNLKLLLIFKVWNITWYDGINLSIPIHSHVMVRIWKNISNKSAFVLFFTVLYQIILWKQDL